MPMIFHDVSDTLPHLDPKYGFIFSDPNEANDLNILSASWLGKPTSNLDEQWKQKLVV